MKDTQAAQSILWLYRYLGNEASIRTQLANTEKIDIVKTMFIGAGGAYGNARTKMETLFPWLTELQDE